MKERRQFFLNIFKSALTVLPLASLTSHFFARFLKFKKQRIINTFVSGPLITCSQVRRYIDFPSLNIWKQKLKGEPSHVVFIPPGALHYSTQFPSAINRDVFSYLILKNKTESIKRLTADFRGFWTDAFSFSHSEKEILSEIKRKNLEHFII